ncbi:MAG: hypothetical protein MUF72_23445 [Elainella sp. Prado103]|jgi:CRISPR-associated protein Csx3|nr:hypothetical protein [Elainella sp. Prado103]
MMKVVLCGPPHSGKSCLREGLKQALLILHRVGQAPYPYVLTACPDGEGAWYAEAAQRDPDLAYQLKQAYKSKFTPEFAQEKAKQVQQLDLPLTIIDVGGRIDDKNRWIMAPATHAVILSNDVAGIPEWQQVCDELHLNVIAILYSDYHATADHIAAETPILRGAIHHLERGEPNHDRPMIKALAARLAQLSVA